MPVALKIWSMAIEAHGFAENPDESRQRLFSSVRALDAPSIGGGDHRSSGVSVLKLKG